MKMKPSSAQAQGMPIAAPLVRSVAEAPEGRDEGLEPVGWDEKVTEVPEGLDKGTNVLELARVDLDVVSVLVVPLGFSAGDCAGNKDICAVGGAVLLDRLSCDEGLP